MKLLLLTQYFPPETGAPQNRLFELAIRLKKMGVEVSILTAMPNYPAMAVEESYKGKLYCLEEMEGMPIHRCFIYASKNRRLIPRLANYFSFVASSIFFGSFKLKNFDIILVESPPLFLGISAIWLSWLKNAKMVFNVSDLWPESAVKLGVVSNSFLIRISTWLEELCIKRASLVSGQTMGIVENIAKRFPQKRVTWLSNGVDLEMYKPEQSLTSWRQENGFTTTDRILIYAGIHGIAQGLEVILNAAERLREIKVLHFVFIGDGPEKVKLENIKVEKGLNNVHFKGLVGKNEIPAIVAASDASIIPLKKLDLFLGAIPSKIFENLAMEKPIFLGVDGESKRLFIDQAHAGWYFEPENDEDLARKIEYALTNSDELQIRGRNGRNFVKKNFDRDNLANDFFQELNNL